MFDTLFESAKPLILAGRHRRDEPPAEGGGRWPVTVVASGAPDSFRERLHRLLTELTRFAGPGHFQTGRADASHITVRALEPYRAAAAPDDPIVSTWLDAMKRTAVDTPTFELACTGLTLTAGGVLAQLEPHDATAWELHDRFRSELGELAWFEETKRNIWYSSIIHFAADIRDPLGLVNWVAERRRFAEPTTFRITGLQLLRSRHTVTASGERYMLPERWFTVDLAGPGPRSAASSLPGHRSGRPE